jgi:hypothetical protein
MISAVIYSCLNTEETGGMVTTMGRYGVVNGSRKESSIGRKKGLVVVGGGDIVVARGGGGDIMVKAG